MHSSKISFVDDDIHILEIYNQLAVIQRWHSACYSSATDYLAARKNDVAHTLLVLDLSMPDIDGFEVIKLLSADEVVPSLLLVSGFDDMLLDSAIKLAKSYGFTAVDIIRKPVDLDLLKTKIGAFLLPDSR